MRGSSHDLVSYRRLRCPLSGYSALQVYSERRLYDSEHARIGRPSRLDGYRSLTVAALFRSAGHSFEVQPVRAAGDVYFDGDGHRQGGGHFVGDHPGFYGEGGLGDLED